ncbi:glypican-6-like protein, partial [Dinothrombium tinctorium]
MTCCTLAMEHMLNTHSKAELDSILKVSITDLHNIFESRAQKFDEFFTELLKTSKRDFHQMFLQTYGLLYEQNSYLFVEMFAELEAYYAKGGIDLSASLDRFFRKLYQKMFQVLNTQYTFDEKYLHCISDHMEALKPFGDVPKKLTIEVKRSFVATRTFVRALFEGRDIVKKLMEILPTNDCGDEFMRMTYCAHCKGLTNLKPCLGYCLNVFKSCLFKQSQVNKEWSNYVDALLLLITRLETSFNIESVVDPIDIKISEAIMNFQEN